MNVEIKNVEPDAGIAKISFYEEINFQVFQKNAVLDSSKELTRKGIQKDSPSNFNEIEGKVLLSNIKNFWLDKTTAVNRKVEGIPATLVGNDFERTGILVLGNDKKISNKWNI